MLRTVQLFPDDDISIYYIETDSFRVKTIELLNQRLIYQSEEFNYFLCMVQLHCLNNNNQTSLDEPSFGKIGHILPNPTQ